ncbi:MAG: fibro-slime domain-containing protein [Treponema sp.]|nr:fibro-slime domain-containing protein [Treponema sp.]
MKNKNLKKLIIFLTVITFCCSCKVNVKDPVHVDEYYQTTEIPIIVRDFIGCDRPVDPSLTAYKHPDFENKAIGTGILPDLLEETLDKDKKPVFNNNKPTASLHIQSKESFSQWFRTIEGVNKEVRKTITFESINNSSEYEFIDEWFLPINGEGFGDSLCENDPRNYNFTVEATFYLLCKENTPIVFTCSSDDDLWLFVNNKIAVNLGGLHPKEIATEPINPEDFNAKPGDYMEIKVFKAERCATGSVMGIKVSQEIYLKK